MNRRSHAIQGTNRAAAQASISSRPLNVRQKKQVKNLIRNVQELKFFGWNSVSAPVTNVGNLTGVPFDVPQGDTDQTRDGDKLQWCGNIDFRMQVVNGLGATADVYNNVRVVIFQWHPNSAPVAGNILLTGAGGGGIVDIYSNYSHDFRQEYKILFDKVFNTIGPGSNVAVSNGPITEKTTTGLLKFKISTKKASKNVQYSNGGLSATNRIYILTISDSSLVTHPTIAYSMKTFYRDS